MIEHILDEEYVSNKEWYMCRIAKEKKLRVWRDFVAKEKTNDSEFDAQVVRILTGDTVLVKTKNGVERKLQLASVKQAPR